MSDHKIFVQLFIVENQKDRTNKMMIAEALFKSASGP